MDKILLVAGCSVFVVLGIIHFVFTLFTNKFEARDPALTESMKRISPILTGRTTMWNAWIGFNASHSLGAVLFGMFYIVIALENYPYLKSSAALNFLLLAVPALYLVLALRYWFDKPRNGILAGLALIVLSLLLRTYP